ncbi:thiamine/thiamine pyrophosphate ABC transporter permease [Granulosicoccaceae sp. 1_MG-2023]|nr:thiamine/thiamine pyrophosphate ABC transporter permease [Granulosicoccaceae sp. 1_MG-2023]
MPGLLAAGFVLCLIVLPLGALIRHGAVQAVLQLSTYQWRVVRFSLWQATLSTLLSVSLAIPVAVALARRPQFPGRAWLIRLFSVSLVIPTVVAVYGIIAIYGNQGWLSRLVHSSGYDWPFNLYGLGGILLAHTFLNLPMSARLLLQALESLSAENWRLAGQLGINGWHSFRLLQWPLIRAALPGIALLVFSLCFTSFAIVMTLGGGPAATTIEVAIYQALRFDFDTATAVRLALVQMLLCCLLILFSARYGRAPLTTVGNGRRVQRYDGNSGCARLSDTLLIGLALLFTLLPFLGIAAAGLSPALWPVLRDPALADAVLRTLTVALGAGCLSVLCACGLLLSATHLRERRGQHLSGRLLELSGSLILVVPPLVLATGLFLLLRRFADVFALALLLTVLINALMGLPFAVRVLEGPFISSLRRHDRLCQSLGIGALQRWRLIEWPVLRRPLGLALAYTSTLAAGDLTAIALFGSQDMRTLPLLLYQRMGSYRLDEAAVTALLLLLLCLLLFWMLERLIGGPAEKAG